ncbi:Uncharacterized protein HZ326_24397 [Fusarium oxysporum f. sp. albedinis]|nr:Uncharacterized protein HZ326_24397 [Fusarium oxysporum f. sp. albedinis]
MRRYSNCSYRYYCSCHRRHTYSSCCHCWRREEHGSRCLGCYRRHGRVVAGHVIGNLNESRRLLTASEDAKASNKWPTININGSFYTIGDISHRIHIYS